MNNIFENAYFGKAYKTRSEDKVFYFEKHSGEYPHMLLFSPTEASYYDDSGKNEYSISLDVVSEWKKEIDEEELEILAYDYCPEERTWATINGYKERDAFKAGYRKALDYLISHK